MLSTIGIAMAMIILVPRYGDALAIYFDQSDFLAVAEMKSTTDFDSFEPVWGFTDHHMALDGILYSAEECSNRCWTFDNHWARASSIVLVSNNISNDIISFGKNRFTHSLGFEFVSPAIFPIRR